jgi:hypothetical protein
MKKFNLLFSLGITIFTMIGISSCNNGSSTSTVAKPNEVPISIGSGMNGYGINTMYVSITLCKDQTGTNCQTIDNIILDTGSFGLKINKSALPESFIASLTRVKTTNDETVYACNTFGSGYVFASEHYAVLQLAGDYSDNVIVQIIENSPTAEIPDSCLAKGPFDNFEDFGANGIIGVNPALTLSNNTILLYRKDTNGIYVALTESEANSVPILNQNPLTSLHYNNNGFVIQIPPTLTNTNTNIHGNLVLGINTNVNNMITKNTNLIVASESSLSTVCNSGCFYSKIENPESTIPAVFDSGTNSWVFISNNIPLCSYGYCPESPFVWNSWVFSYDFAPNESYQVTAIITKDEESAGQELSFSVMPGWGYENTNNETLYGSPFFFGKNVYIVFPSKQNSSPIWGFESYR